jgi:hypothetical protein
MKKRLFLLAIVIAVALSVLTLPCLVAGAEEVEPSVVPSVAVSSVVDDSTPSPTLISRFTEWVNSHWAEAVSALSGALTVLFYSVALPYLRGKLKKVAGREDLGTMVEAINSLIDTLNKIEDAHNKKNDEQDEALAKALLDLENAKIKLDAVLDVLQIVYGNSKNVPQCVKDIINTKYAKAIKTTDGVIVKETEGVAPDDEQNKI